MNGSLSPHQGNMCFDPTDKQFVILRQYWSQEPRKMWSMLMKCLVSTGVVLMSGCCVGMHGVLDLVFVPHQQKRLSYL